MNFSDSKVNFIVSVWFDVNHAANNASGDKE